MTSHNGLVRSVFSFFGIRFRKKYGAIGEISQEAKGRKERQRQGIQAALLVLKYHRPQASTVFRSAP